MKQLLWPALFIVAVFVGAAVNGISGVLGYVLLMYVIMRASPGIRQDIAAVPWPSRSFIRKPRFKGANTL